MRYVYGVISIAIICFILQQQTCSASPAAERFVRQTKGPNSADQAQADVKILNALGGNQPQTLPSFGGPIPYPARYGGLAYGGSTYPGALGMGLFGAGSAGAFPGFNALQAGNPASLGLPTIGSYVGNNLPPYPLNSQGPEVIYAHPALNAASNLNNFFNMGNMQASPTGSESAIALLGLPVQMTTQMPLQGQASQPQPQLAAGYPFATTFYGPLNGYGPGFQSYQLL